MSGWYERAKAFAANTPAKAEDMEAEMDNIAEAFNGLFNGRSVAASGDLTLTGILQDVPGASASISVSRPSVLLVAPPRTSWRKTPASPCSGRPECRRLGPSNVDGGWDH